MELHLHLTVAFRDLDRKWGPAIDLETSEESLVLPCLPAMIERPSTTFSSEEYLKKSYRPKPYSRIEERRRRKENVKINDSFADISSSRIPTLSEVDATSVDSGLDEDCRTVTSLVEEFGRSDSLGSTTTLDSVLDEMKPVRIFKHLKTSAKSFIDKKCWKKVRLG